MNTKQPTLTGLPDYHQPQTVRGNDLLTTIAAANVAGFRAIRLTVKRAAVYQVVFVGTEPRAPGRPGGNQDAPAGQQRAGAGHGVTPVESRFPQQGNSLRVTMREPFP